MTGEVTPVNRTAGQKRHNYKVMDIRYDSFCALMASPDPPDLPVRRHHRTYGGDPARKDRIKWELAAAYVGHRMQLHGQQDAVVSVRRHPLRLVKKPVASDEHRQIERRTWSA